MVARPQRLVHGAQGCTIGLKIAGYLDHIRCRFWIT
jgi:hypothetical protein